jgi:hypothetical protein
MQQLTEMAEKCNDICISFELCFCFAELLKRSCDLNTIQIDGEKAKRRNWQVNRCGTRRYLHSTKSCFLLS